MTSLSAQNTREIVSTGMFYIDSGNKFVYNYVIGVCSGAVG
jgi:hypothetical protein